MKPNTETTNARKQPSDDSELSELTDRTTEAELTVTEREG